ncbi:MAG: histidinol dehydrogenase [Gemmatimonadetes bacterium]|nr:histidinol dehydrogenase [Gemmatimonadota bacterium]MYG86585.1 histidinol dehydrogenase [Gemmatimonadota bacterium]MYJ89547.1 histidinol dehydrogenase [Gemmatimonadota bacterium]
MRILSAEEAGSSILRRRPLNEAMHAPEIEARNSELFGEPLTAEQAVARIIDDVRDNGDDAIRRYARLLDGSVPEFFEVPQCEIDDAAASLPSGLRDALETAAGRIRTFHARQPAGSWTHWDEEGGTGQIVRPLDRVGVYAPGGGAVYPSSLLMAVIPARVAGVREVVVATPPGRDGAVTSAVLAAASVAGADTVYRIGGAQAIAAMAHGTGTVPRVDKIVGPGNVFVTLAKRQVYGIVDIDQLAGPTETLLIADETARPDLAAADLLAQAEHDAMASAILITPSSTLALAVQQAVEEQLAELDRADTIRSSLARNGGIVLVSGLAAAVELANAYAPEHLCLLVADPWPLVDRVRHAGGIFVGEHSSEALGDYVTGPSHVMPTGGSARFHSPLSVRDFLKITSLFAVNERAEKRLGPAAIRLAEAEGLSAHAMALRRRLSKDRNGG